MRSSAKKIFVCNLLTESGETNGESVEDHTERLEEYLLSFARMPRPEGRG